MFNRHRSGPASRYSLGRKATNRFLSARIVSAGIVGVAACATALPALGQALPAPTTRTGTVNAKLTVDFAVAPPAGSTVACSLALIGSDTRSPSDSKSSSAPVSGKTAVCLVKINYGWHLSNAATNMTIAYSVLGTAQASFAIYNIIPVPPNGTVTPVTVTISQ